MSVDVIYQGLSIARNAGVRTEGGALFVEMDGPMPVATELTLAYEGHRLEGRVGRIHEGVGSGILFHPAGALPDWIHKVRPRTVQTVELEAEPEPEAPIALAKPAVPQAAPVVHAPAPAAQAPAPQAAQAPVPAPAPAAPAPVAQAQEPVVPAPVAQAQEPVVPAPVAQAQEPAAPAPVAQAQEPAAMSLAPTEATQEMAIPSADDEAKFDSDGEPPGAVSRPGKKKKSSRRR